MDFVLDLLNDEHDLTTFSCGVESLDLWLRVHAKSAAKKKVAQTYVWRTNNTSIAGYFSLAAHNLQKNELLPKIGRGSPDSIPAVLIAKLGLDYRYHHQGLGGELLHAACTMSLVSSQLIGARFVVVEAIDVEVSDFYRRNGFQECADNPLRLVRKISDIERELSS